jgi:hypothetical protein
MNSLSIFAQFITAPPHHLPAGLHDVAAGSAVVEIDNLIFGWPGANDPILDIQTLWIEKGKRCRAVQGVIAAQ